MWWLVYLLLLNAALGLAALEWAWKKLAPVRDPANENLHKKYYGFRRLDVAKWKKMRFQIGAATTFLPKLIGFILVIFVTGVLTKLVTLGVTVTEERPLTGWRSKAVNFFIYVGASVLL